VKKIDYFPIVIYFNFSFARGLFMLVKKIIPKPGQESVWDYPRPPRVEACDKHIKIVFNGVIIADSKNTQRVLETSHPPVYYIPPADIKMEYLQVNQNRSFCEWKGIAGYYDLKVGDPAGINSTVRLSQSCAWYYPNPTPPFLVIKDYLAFYPSKMDICYVNDEQVTAQPGDFYGGWITRDIVGPFKGNDQTQNN
jgi:uncharacterized protein (DUF427 family)